MIVRSVGDQDPRFAVAAADIADEARQARAALAHLGPDDDLEEISLTATGSLHLSRILDTPLGDGLLLFVDLDRARSNVGLASRLVGQAASAVLA
jgi:hypothetical protein